MAARIWDDPRLQPFIDRVRWLERHHHAIDPKFFAPQEIDRRQQLLLKMNGELSDIMRSVRNKE